MVLRTALWIGASPTTLLAMEVLWTRQRLPRLRAARGLPRGCLTSNGATLNVLVVGESSVAGVGVADLQDGLAAQLARELHARLRRTIQWHAIGRPGATVRAIHAHILRQQDHAEFRADIAVFAVGVNDCLRLRSPRRWHRDVERLVRAIERQHRCQLIVLSPVPPLWRFRSLPWLLRLVLGWQAFVLDRVLQRIARCKGKFLYAPVHLADQCRLLARDGFHPSTAGYHTWAIQLALAIVAAPDCSAP